jgi:hypothetical protein
VIGLLLLGSAVQLSPWKLDVQEIEYDVNAARLFCHWVATAQKTGSVDGLRNLSTWDESMSRPEWPSHFPDACVEVQLAGGVSV